MHLFHHALTLVFLYYLTNVECVESGKNGVGSDYVSRRGLQRRESPTKECDCGRKSQGCHLENGQKVCDCKFRHKQIDGICKPYCEEHYQCDNGARCVMGSCKCLPGTRGDFCQKVDECDGDKGIRKCGNPDDVHCDYNEETHKAYCRCRIYEYQYYAPNKTCIECDCNDEYGNCTLVDAVKTCSCNPGSVPKRVNYGYKVECAPCDCGEHSLRCYFPMGVNDSLYWKQVCECEEGYAQTDKYCHECDCGPHGNCSYELFRFYKICNCEDGYKPYTSKTEKYCKECDCGEHGVCSYDDEVKKCKCNKGYADKNGNCVECDCDGKGDCSYENDEKRCKCPEGYEENNGSCIDINECLSNPDICRYDSVCNNTIGSYECYCEKGYMPYKEGGDIKVHGCIDIDECENEEMCSRENTRCINSDGSYICECRRGFEPVTPHESPIPAGCQAIVYESQTSLSWNTIIIVIAVVFGICAIGLVTVIYMKNRARRDFLPVGTPLQNVQ